MSSAEQLAFGIPRDVLHVIGPDATAFLQGQLTQDVEAIVPGSSAWSFLLQPQGKTEAWLRITRVSDDEYLLDFDGGHADAVADRLRRFLLRVKCDIQQLDWYCTRMIGRAGGHSASVLEVPLQWPGLDGVDVFFDDADLSDSTDEAAYEPFRIEAGMPAIGHEIVDSVIPQETGLTDVAVSFTKGCYTGQELVARIDSRGHVNRRLVGLTGDGLRSGDRLVAVDSDRELGTITSAALSQRLDTSVALGYVRREVDPGATLDVMDGDQPRAARVQALPLVS